MFLRKLCFILGGIALAYGIVILILLGAGAPSHWIFTILGAVLLLAGAMLRKIRTWNIWVKRVLCVLLILCLADFVWFEARAIAMSVRGSQVQPKKTAEYAAEGSDVDSVPWDWIVVLGAGIDGNGKPKQEFSVRLQRAEELSTERNGLILTGGRGSDEVLSEAQSGKNYLDSRGKLRAAEVFLETDSTNTMENLRNALEIIKNNGGSEEDKVLIVSSGFHLFRASLLAEKAGYKNIECAGATGLSILLPCSYVQEYVSYVVAGIKGYI